MGSLGHSPLSVSLIGAGVIGAMHASLLDKSQETSLTSVVDPTPNGRALAEQYHCAYFHDVKTLLQSRPPPEAAIICTPNDTHVSIAQELAEAGVHLLIEKPISTDVESGARLLRYCQARGVRVCIGHHRRFHGRIKASKQCLDEGRIGTVLGISGLWATLKPLSYFANHGAWRAGPAGGVVLINLIHEVDLLQSLLGPIVRVYAEQAPSTRGNVAEEGVAVTFRFASGAVGTFLALDNSPSPHSIERGTGENPAFPRTGSDCYRIFGTRGTLSIPDGQLWTPDDIGKAWNSDMTKFELTCKDVEVYVEQLSNFIEVVRGRSKPVCSGEAGSSAVAVCVAIKTSLVTGKRVSREEVLL